MKTLTILFLLHATLLVGLAQQSGEESRILRNQDVIEMIKSGLSDTLIIAKIKNSSTQFNTSTIALKELKDGGATDNLILAIIEAKPKSQTLNTNQTPAEMKDAVGKKKVFVESDDDEAKLMLLKQVKEKKFEVVSEISSAELVFDMKVRTETVAYKAGIYRGGVDRTSEARLCNLSVYLRNDVEKRLVFVKDIKSIYDDSSFAMLFGGGAMPGLKYQIPGLLNSFMKELKKAEKAKSK